MVSVACAMRPVIAPLIKRMLVYVAHLSRGARSGSPRVMRSGSPSIEAAPTTAAANGLINTAATSIGMLEIESSIVLVRRTLLLSPTAAARASAAIVSGFSTP